jgi:hypothetical protein
MYVRPATPEQLDGFYSHAVFKILSFRGQFLVNMNILTPKIAVLSVIPKNKIAMSSKTSLTIVITFQ